MTLPLKAYEAAAKKALKENDYPVWHHTCKTYLPMELTFTSNNQVLDLAEKDANTSLLAGHMITAFMDVFTAYRIIYHGYTEECYEKAEEYKLSKYNIL